MRKINSRSAGVKLIVVCGLALVMTIPAFFVGLVIDDRMKRATDVVQEISDRAGGQQTFLGPTLAVPYGVRYRSNEEFVKRGQYIVFPAQAEATLKSATEERQRSLFRVPVYQADLKLDATFDLTGLSGPGVEGAELDWSRAQIIVGASGPRGALADALLTVDAKTSTLVPVEEKQGLSIAGGEKNGLKLMLFGTKVEGVPGTGHLSVSSALRFSGAQRISVLAYGKTTHLVAKGDWASPGFGGGFLPIKRTVTKNGFSAEWSVPLLARGVAAEGPGDSIKGLDASALSVSFIEVADPYQSVSRSLKYVLLFLGLIFLSYFVFEVTSGKRVHPAQYILVGMAQIIFYLLLLSFGERIGFDFAFLVAGGATVGLLSANAVWVFSSRAQGVRALGIFSLLYLAIYWLLRLEDNALLAGAVASFMALAAAMYWTRNIDWNGTSTLADSPQ